ncbi:MAG: hypothetical protein AAFP84_19215 [Actinomycetota bacterium]
MSDEQVVRRAAFMLLVVVAPFLGLGAVLTISLFGAVFGLPLLLATIPPTLIAWRVRTAPSDSVRLGRFVVASAFVAGVLAVAIVLAAAVARDDLDTTLEWGLLAVAVGWVAAAWWVAFTAQRLSATS